MAINLAGLDLNLMVVLDALLQEESVTRAGERVGLSQPAVSNALNRLRYVLNDPILERDGRRMRLTERGHLIREPLREILDGLRHVLSDPVVFDPATAHFRIRLFASDYVTFVLLPALRRRLMRAAPFAQLDISFADRARVVEQLANGHVDVAIGRYDNTPAEIRRTLILTDHHVVLAHADHPVLKGPLDVERLVSYPRIATSFEGRNYGYFERDLARAGGMVDCSIVMPHLLSAPILTAETDMVTISSRRIAEGLARLLPVGWRPTPFDSEPVPIEIIWHEHSDQDPAQAWFRGLVIATAASLDQDATTEAANGVARPTSPGSSGTRATLSAVDTIA